MVLLPLSPLPVPFTNTPITTGKHKEPEAKEQDKATDRVEKEKDDEKEKLP